MIARHKEEERVMILFLECDESLGNWRREFNENMIKAFKEFGVAYKRIGTPDEGVSILAKYNDVADTVLFVGDTQETRWHELVASAKCLRVGHKHGGRFVYLDFANVYDFNVIAEYEECLLFDKIFVNSTHMQTIYRNRNVETIVTGFPFDFSRMDKYKGMRKIKGRVIVNSRLTSDKNPLMLLDFLSTWGRDLEVVFLLPKPYFESPQVHKMWYNVRSLNKLDWTVYFDLPREEYYEQVAQGEFVLNFAQAETLGLSVIEAMYLGLTPVVPDGLGYADFVPSRNRYTPYAYPDIMKMLRARPRAVKIKSDYDYRKVFAKYMKEVGYDV